MDLFGRKRRKARNAEWRALELRGRMNSDWAKNRYLYDEEMADLIMVGQMVGAGFTASQIRERLGAGRLTAAVEEYIALTARLEA